MLYDCLIIGAGPAGLSAAIYMGRFLRKTLVLDAGEGRSSFNQVNDNYLGFPNGVNVGELRELGRQQAQRFGVEFIDCKVDALRREGKNFVAATGQGELRARTVILCTGVCDNWPAVANVEEFVGKSLFWCITCDGFRTVGKKLLLLGADDEGATTACQFQLYTNDVAFILLSGHNCTPEKLADLSTHGIRVIHGDPAAIIGTPEEFKGIQLASGEEIPGDIAFSLLGCSPTNKLALDLDVKCSPGGYVLVDDEGYTSVPGVFCAGDLSLMHTHQVVSAASEGAEAGQTANYYLYADYQKEED